MRKLAGLYRQSPLRPRHRQALRTRRNRMPRIAKALRIPKAPRIPKVPRIPKIPRDLKAPRMPKLPGMSSLFRKFKFPWTPRGRRRIAAEDAVRPPRKRRPAILPTPGRNSPKRKPCPRRLSAALQPELSAAAGPSPVPSPCRVPS